MEVFEGKVDFKGLKNIKFKKEYQKISYEKFLNSFEEKYNNKNYSVFISGMFNLLLFDTDLKIDDVVKVSDKYNKMFGKKLNDSFKIKEIHYEVVNNSNFITGSNYTIIEGNIVGTSFLEKVD